MFIDEMMVFWTKATMMVFWTTYTMLQGKSNDETNSGISEKVMADVYESKEDVEEDKQNVKEKKMHIKARRF